MSALALASVTEALRRVLAQAIKETSGDLSDVEDSSLVYVGPPLKNEIGERRASLFLFHIEPNAELRNAERHAPPPPLEPAEGTAAVVDALPLDLRYLITVFRTTGGGDGNATGDPNELTTLGLIIRALHQAPTLAGAGLDNQVVRLTPEPYPMEELSRVWGLFPQDEYRTSMVYLASPVFVEASPFAVRPPVLRREQRSGMSGEPPDIAGRRRAEA